MGVFSIESEMTFDGKGCAGIVFGADDYRFENKEFNEMLIEGKNYISAVIDKTRFPKKIAVYRVGYSPDDKEGVPLAEYDIPGSSPENSFFMKLDVTGNCMNININGTFISRIQ